MPKKGANISLSSYDDIFSTQESRQETGEHVIMLPLDAIHPFKNHPFRIVDDEEMQKTAESIREYGVLVPAIVRPLENGEYEMISGHRRRYASMLAGKETMPVIIREMDDDILDFTLTDEEMAEIAKIDKGVRYYHRTDEQLVQFAGWRPAFEKE